MITEALQCYERAKKIDKDDNNNLSQFIARCNIKK